VGYLSFRQRIKPGITQTQNRSDNLNTAFGNKTSSMGSLYIIPGVFLTAAMLWTAKFS